MIDSPLRNGFILEFSGAILKLLISMRRCGRTWPNGISNFCTFP